MSHVKMNALHLHLTDDQSWPVYIPELPVITNKTAYSPVAIYTAEDLRDLVAFGRLRGVIVFPEIDFPSHSSGLFAALPALGCQVGAPGQTYPALIDPLYPDLMSNLASIFGALNDVFPPSYPFHIGGDEVERGLFNNCSNAIAFAASRNVTGDISTFVTAWFERSLYEMLIAPPFNRRVMAWSDVGAGLVDETWTNVSTNLILEQWDGAPGVWTWDTCASLSVFNASVVMAGPFSILHWPVPQDDYVDLWNITCLWVPLPQTQTDHARARAHHAHHALTATRTLRALNPRRNNATKAQIMGPETMLVSPRHAVAQLC